ncbi:SWI/SNF chromatin-remodeling complex subunit [Pestalotiopsis sp. IQ-011]
MAGTTRSGAGSPSHDLSGSGRLFSKRAREIQAQEGLPLNPWGGPPTSGNSTPLRENIPESPTDGFPDFAQLPTPDSGSSGGRRARAGTVPSRFPGAPVGNGLLSIPTLNAQSSRVSPSQSPFNKSPSPGLGESSEPPRSGSLLSRLRAGSMPQRSPYNNIPGTSSPFGPTLFSGSWNPSGRERGNTLASIASVGSTNGPSSPAQSAFSKEGSGENDVHMRTLDYLGLAETPQPARAQLAAPYLPGLADFTKQANRFRSYSVNNKDKYADEDDDDYDDLNPENQYAALVLQDQLAATQAAIHSHNMAVQNLQNLAAQSIRPRARTVGGLDLTAAGSRGLRNFYHTPSRLDSSMTATEIRLPDENDFEDLPQAVAAMNLGRSNSRNNGLLSAEEGLEGPTSALWLGSIPTSTTTSTLTEMFKQYGPISSVRVLTHKNCGFVNYERVDSAISAKTAMNGKEIFPGAGPVRINFAKPPSASNTPGHDGVFPSPSPDPFAKGGDNAGSNAAAATSDGAATTSQANAAPVIPPLHEITADIVQIVKSFGATEEDTYRISLSLNSAVSFTNFLDEIPPVREPTHTRVHDAPKLRDIRKRIDNQSLAQPEIEGIAVDMLPEIAELASDYLGNTVVQKLFEHCSDPIRDLMLNEIAPHLAEIGVHKNGTWAAQKIIDVCKTPQQMTLIVEHVRPYTVPLFLDQYGNYVLQGCLKFGTPFNDFIFETMLSKMWDIGQGRYGARAMRACLESHHASKDQQRMLAGAIALNSVQLATNANGALLLTWFLDTCTFPQRRSVLAPQLVPYLVHLCTHKVAYLTVLKVINQKAEADARDTILKALFFTPKDHVLEAILSDHACGATLIFKVLTTPFFDESIRSQVVENVKNVLIRIKAQPNQGYKRLMDEVGLSTRNGGGSRDHSISTTERQRPASRQAQAHAQANAAAIQQNAQYGNQYMNPLNAVSTPGGYDMGFGAPRSEAGDSAMPQFPQYGQQNAMYSGTNPAMVPNMQQMQYQQNMLQRGNPSMNGFFPPMPAGFNGYNSSTPPMDQYRGQNLANSSPIQPPGAPAGYGPPGFNMPMGMGGYGYNSMGGMQNMPYVQEQPINTRRGRR